VADGETGFEPAVNTSLVERDKIVSGDCAWPDESEASSGLLVRAPSLTSLAHKGTAQEIEGSTGSGRWCCCCWSIDSLSRLPSTPMEGEAGWWGEVQLLSQPVGACHQPHEGGRQRGGGGVLWTG
jgi:hypothetical protein